MPSYRPFLVRIAQPVDGAYPVTGEFQGLEAHSSIPGDVLRQCLDDAATLSNDHSSQLGSRLFAAVFTGDVLRLYNTAQAWLGPQERLRIVLAQPLPEPLPRLPWELIFDAPAQPRSLATTHNAPLVRHAPAAALPHAPPQRGALRVLAVTAFPPGVLPDELRAGALAASLPARDVLRRLASDVQAGAGRDATRWLLKGRRYQVTTLDSPTLDELSQHVTAAESGGAGYHVVHFFGQATPQGAFLLPDGAGAWSTVTPAELAQACVEDTVAVFAVTICQPDFPGDAIRCAAQEATQAGVPAVVGMHASQFDRTVVDFSREFYRALAVGEPLELAVAYGRRLVAQLHGSAAAPPLPALYMAHTGGLALPALDRVHLLPRAWRFASWLLATVFAVVGTTSGILDLPNFPRMLRDRAPVIRCVYPNAMDPNKLTIAFQPLTVVNENGMATGSSQGRAVSEFLFQRFRPVLADLKLSIPYEVRGPSLACALPGRTAEARAAAAASLAGRINADILVYGVITDTATTDRVALAFQIGYGGFENQEELAGPYALGGPLAITLPFDPEALLAIEHPPHLVRMNVLAEMVVGLAYLSADNPEKSLEYLRRATTDEHWPRADGKEFAYLLLGHALLRQGSLRDSKAAFEEALQSYETAVSIQPQYNRARLARASALTMLAVADKDAADRRVLNRERLAVAESAYQEMLAPGAPPMTLRETAAARAGLGYIYATSAAYRQCADAACKDLRSADEARARAELAPVVAQYESGEAGLAKIAGSCYGYLGGLDRSAKDWAAAAANYRRATELVAPVSRALYLSLWAEVACSQGDRGEAERLYNAAIDDARLYGRAAEVDRYIRLLTLLQGRSCP